MMQCSDHVHLTDSACLCTLCRTHPESDSAVGLGKSPRLGRLYHAPRGAWSEGPPSELALACTREVLLRLFSLPVGGARPPAHRNTISARSMTRRNDRSARTVAPFGHARPAPQRRHGSVPLTGAPSLGARIASRFITSASQHAERIWPMLREWPHFPSDGCAAMPSNGDEVEAKGTSL